jgi:glucose-1-phosphate adenylyltransferase
MNLDTLVIVLAGGAGERLYPLTHDRSKPATPFGSNYRLIDVPLSNAFKSGLRQVLVLTQGKDQSLNKHIKNTWPSDPKFDSFVETTSPQNLDTRYEGDADAVRKIKRQIKYHNPKTVLVVPGDHILKMNYATMLEMMRHADADAAIASIRRPARPEYTSQLGALEMNAESRVTKLEEKNPNTKLRVLDDQNSFYASMGIYGFKTQVLLEALELTGNGFGKNIFPQIVEKINVFGYDYMKHNAIPDLVRVANNGYLELQTIPRSPDSDYWKDVGTIGEFFDAHIDLVSFERPQFNLYNPLWPFFTYHHERGPAKLVVGPVNALTGAGAIMTEVDGGDVVLFTDTYVNKSHLEGVIAFDRADIQKCNIRKTIVDKDSKLRAMEIGYDVEKDMAAGIWVDQDSGIRVVPKEYNCTSQKSMDYFRRAFDIKREEMAQKSK